MAILSHFIPISPIILLFLPFVASSWGMLATVTFITLSNSYLIYKNRIEMAVSLYIVVLAFVSSETSGMLSGTPYSMSGVGKINLSLSAYATISLATSMGVYLPQVRKSGRSLLSIFLILLMLFCDAISNMGSVISNKLADNYLVPVIGAFIIARYIHTEMVPNLIRFFYQCILVNAVIAIIEYLVGHSLLMHDYLNENVEWYAHIYRTAFYDIPFRGCSFLGHPLVNSLYFLVAVVYNLKAKHKNKFLGLIELLILALAILATNSRAALLVFILYLYIHLIITHQYMLLLFLAGILVAVLVFQVDYQQVYSEMFSRDQTGDSISVRFAALDTVGKIPWDVWLTGIGFNNAATYVKTYISHNFEIAYLIVLLENGAIGFVFWCASVVSMYHRKMVVSIRGVPVKKMLNDMLIVFFVLSATFNSFGDPNTLGYLMWMLLALTGVAADKTYTRIEGMAYGS